MGQHSEPSIVVEKIAAALCINTVEWKSTELVAFQTAAFYEVQILLLSINYLTWLFSDAAKFNTFTVVQR